MTSEALGEMLVQFGLAVIVDQELDEHKQYINIL